jgi:hypothetical protein
VPLTLGGGGVGHPRLRDAHAYEEDAMAREAFVRDTVLQVVQQGATACAQDKDKTLAAIERMEGQHLQKEREEAQRKDHAETRKAWMQLVLTAVGLGLAVRLLLRDRSLETAALGIITAVLGLWGGK